MWFHPTSEALHSAPQRPNLRECRERAASVQGASGPSRGAPLLSLHPPQKGGSAWLGKGLRFHLFAALAKTTSEEASLPVNEKLPDAPSK